MKTKILMLLAVCAVLCSACGLEVPPNSTFETLIPASAVPSNATMTPTVGPSAPIESDGGKEETWEAGVPSAPAIPLGIADKIDDLLLAYIGREIPLEYVISRPPDAFFSAIEQLSDEGYLRLKDQKNFLQIGDYVIFNVYDYLEDQFKIQMEDAQGNSQTIFSSRRIIQSIQFFAGGRLAVNIVETKYFGATKSEYYILDLAQETLSLHYDEFFIDSMESSYYWYDNKLIIPKNESNVGLGVENYYLRGNGEDLLLAENALWVLFDSGKMYYMKHEEDTLYSLNLDTLSSNIVYTFSEGGPRYLSVYRDRLFLKENQSLIIFDMNSHESMTIEMGEIFGIGVFTDSGMFRVDGNKVLWHITFDGEETKLLKNFEAGKFAISGDFVYFRGLGNHPEAGFLWKNDLSANSLVLESTLQ